MRYGIFSLVAAALLTLTLPCSAADAAPRDDSASEKLGMKLSLQCYTYRALTFFEAVDKAARLGVKYIEIYPGQKIQPGSEEKISKNMSDEDNAAVLKKLADAGGLKLVAYGVDGVATDEAGARKEFEWAKKMGIKVLVTETTPNDVHEKLTQEYNIRFALHNHPQSWAPDHVLKACEGKNKLIGSCSDLGHWQRRAWVPTEQLKKLEGRVEHLHFKDLNALALNAHDVPWGTGKGDPKGCLEELKRQGFQGCMSIEYETGSVEELDKNLPLCVAFFDKTLTELAK